MSSNTGALGDGSLRPTSTIEHQQSHGDMADLRPVTSVDGDATTFDIPITHGQVQTFKSSRYQGHAAPVVSPSDIQTVTTRLRASQLGKKISSLCFAFRVGSVCMEEGVPDDGTVFEDCDDGEDFGSGLKLLHVLQKWDVKNIIVIVTREDFGIPDRLGNHRFAVIVDSCKLVLETCFLDAIGNTCNDTLASPKEASRFPESPPGRRKGPPTKPAKDKRAIPALTHAISPVVNRNMRGNTHVPISSHFVPGYRDHKVTFFANNWQLPAANNGDKLYLSKSDCTTLKAIVRPHEEVYKVVQLVGEMFQYPDLSWAGLREMISARMFREQLYLRSGSSGRFQREVLVSVHQLLFSEIAHPHHVRQISIPACKLLEWVLDNMVDYAYLCGDQHTIDAIAEAFGWTQNISSKQQQDRSQAGARGGAFGMVPKPGRSARRKPVAVKTLELQ